MTSRNAPSENHPLPIVLILGPTAGGKTALAIELAQRLGVMCGRCGECVSADSMQVYRGMDIGTAKPTAAERAGVAHHLIDLVEPDDDTFSVDRWLEFCRAKISEIRGRSGVPIIVGGTNLYVQALLGGMADVPPPDARLRAEFSALTLEQLRARLEAVDPVGASRIHRNDRRRTIRALEVFEQTGQPLSAMQTQWTARREPARPARPMDQAEDSADAQAIFVVGLNYPVEAINRRINARVRAMIEAGLVEEVRALHAANRLGRNAREALGYQQVIDVLEGRCALEEAIEQIKIRTRRYAKQQRTWLRRFAAYQPSAWLEAADKTTQTLADQALAAIRQWRQRTVAAEQVRDAAEIDLAARRS